MLRGILVVFASFICCCCHGQLKKFYSVKNESSFDTIQFSLKATSGTCHIKPSYHADPVTIYGNPDFSDVNPNFQSEIWNKLNKVNLNLEDYKKSGLSQTIAFNVFGSDEKDDMNFWKVYLNDEKIYKLNLNYGVGSANVDLSGIPVSDLRIETGSADVNVKYDLSKPNSCPMDTFLVKVDLGSISAQNVNLSNAKCIVADVGFGNAVLDFNENPTDKCSVNASVGAGNLKVIMPNKNTPAIVYFKKSPLCNISIKEGFEEVDNNVFVNKEYKADAKNLMTFTLDVALGNITFEYKD
ncbi:MAG: hypothetical protein JXQ96_00430 [Cyclobacteriaceae bacterium]